MVGYRTPSSLDKPLAFDASVDSIPGGHWRDFLRLNFTVVFYLGVFHERVETQNRIGRTQLHCVCVRCARSSTNDITQVNTAENFSDNCEPAGLRKPG